MARAVSKLKHAYIDIQVIAISSSGPPGLCASMPVSGLAETSPNTNSAGQQAPAGTQLSRHPNNKVASSCRALNIT